MTPLEMNDMRLVRMCTQSLDVKSIPKNDWDGLLQPDESPFLEHDWIYAMEESKCATMDSGACRRQR